MKKRLGIIMIMIMASTATCFAGSIYTRRNMVHNTKYYIPYGTAKCYDTKSGTGYVLNTDVTNIQGGGAALAGFIALDNLVIESKSATRANQTQNAHSYTPRQVSHEHYASSALLQ